MILLPQNKDGGVSFTKHADVCGGVEEGGPVASQRTGKTGPPRRARPTGVGTADSSPALPGPLPDEVPWLAHESADSWPLLSRRSPETSQALSSDSDKGPWWTRPVPENCPFQCGTLRGLGDVEPGAARPGLPGSRGALHSRGTALCLTPNLGHLEAGHTVPETRAEDKWPDSLCRSQRARV